MPHRLTRNRSGNTVSARHRSRDRQRAEQDRPTGGLPSSRGRPPDVGAAAELLAEAGDAEQAVVDREPEARDRSPRSARTATAGARVDRAQHGERAETRSNPPIATGSNAATPRNTASDSSASSGNAISSAIASELVAWEPVCWPATAVPPSTTAWSAANAWWRRLTTSLSLALAPSVAATSTCRPSRDTAADWPDGGGSDTRAIPGSTRSVRATRAISALERRARTSAITPAVADSPVARSIRARARVACEPGSSNAFEAPKLPGAGPPTTPTITNSSRPIRATRRGREHDRVAKRPSTLTSSARAPSSSSPLCFAYADATRRRAIAHRSTGLSWSPTAVGDANRYGCPGPGVTTPWS